MKKHILYSVFYILYSVSSFSQSKNSQKVEILNTNYLDVDESIGKDVKRLIGNVQLKHENALMYCDSAYLYPNKSIEAFGNVRIQQGDSVNIYGQFLKYNGNTRMAELQKNVRFIQKGTTLQTELLYYDMKTSMANYPNGGTIVSKQNTLTSQLGYFNTKKNSYSFKKNVTLTNPNYVMNCDTLNYFSGTNTAYFSGPTEIKNTNNYIYCESGWYNMDNDIAKFSKNAYIITQQQKMKGDTIFYDKTKDIGKAVGNVALIDSAQNIIVTGDYAIHSGKHETSTITGHALLKQYFDTDTLFLHADTLRAVNEHPINSKNERDTSVTWKSLYAFNKVKFFRSDIQGKCDSLVYSGKDSVMRLYKDPVLLSEENQLTA
ncbi:MAG: OstA-like protein, partial [Bacteroidota bacterium]